MKVLKIILIIVVILAAVYVFLPGSSHVERSVMINSQPEKVYTVVNNMHRFNDWSPWAKIDPNTQYEFEGPESGEGAKMSWTSDHNEVGNGSQWIEKSVPNKEVVTMLTFDEGDPAKAKFLLEPTDEGTKVTWAFDAELTGFMKIIGLGMDGFLGPMYEEGLNNLKNLVENMPDDMETTDEWPEEEWPEEEENVVEN
ncbi:SRPBCC family protein [Rapidithrix thailandica]|uniref:SRPBCC family protein n=1 Tax=Rapidithrix thailandica TaxID=413964 RepID=A0AAW9SF80_9BACT